MSNADQTPQKPGLARQLAPWVFAAAILAYMFWKVDFREVLNIMAGAHGSWIVAAYLAYCLVYYLTDVLSFHRSYNWFNIGIPLRETTRLRFASYAVQAVNGALTEVMSVLYMVRVKKVSALAATSTAGFVYFNETVTLFVLLSGCAFFLPEANRIPQIWPAFQAIVVLGLLLTPAWIYFWNSGLKDRWPRLRDHSALTAFRQATPAQYLEVFLYRFGNNLVSLFANVIMLKAIGIDAPLPLLIAVVPLMVNVAYWPVSVGGFGGPQLVAKFLLAGQATEAQILAYSLIWSALFFLTRTATGIPFLRPVFRAAFDRGETRA